MEGGTRTTHICHSDLRSLLLQKIRRAFDCIMSSLREAFVSSRRVGVMEQASGNFITGKYACVLRPHLPASHFSITITITITITFVVLFGSSSINTFR